MVSAVCHGPAGFLEVKVGGDHLVNGQNVTGFSWTEEGLAKRDQAVPYSLEEELKNRGAKYGKGDAAVRQLRRRRRAACHGPEPGERGAAVGAAVAKKFNG